MKELNKKLQILVYLRSALPSFLSSLLHSNSLYLRIRPQCVNISLAGYCTHIGRRILFMLISSTKDGTISLGSTPREFEA